jgi:hypothetical protein
MGENNSAWKGGISKNHMTYRRRFIKKNPDKIKCHKKFARKIKSGEIKRGNCIVCGKPDAHGHHEDYSKPYDVIWLCQLHHNQYSTGKIKLSDIMKNKPVYGEAPIITIYKYFIALESIKKYWKLIYGSELKWKEWKHL